MLCLIEVGFRDVPQILVVTAILAVVVAYFYRGFKGERSSYKDEVISDLTKLVGVHKQKIEELTVGLEGYKTEHAKCQRTINDITALNLRLQARQQLYERTINRLELRLGIELTDFINVSHAPEDPDFG